MSLLGIFRSKRAVALDRLDVEMSDRRQRAHDVGVDLCRCLDDVTDTLIPDRVKLRELGVETRPPDLESASAELKRALHGIGVVVGEKFNIPVEEGFLPPGVDMGDGK